MDVKEKLKGNMVGEVAQIVLIFEHDDRVADINGWQGLPRIPGRASAQGRVDLTVLKNSIFCVS